MRWALLLLVAANLAILAYLLLIDRPAARVTDVRALGVNADKVKQLKPATATVGPRACLQWSNLGAAELARAQKLLAELKVEKLSVLDKQILVVEPTPALTVRLAEAKADFPGSELSATVCPAGLK